MKKQNKESLEDKIMKVYWLIIGLITIIGTAITLYKIWI